MVERQTKILELVIEKERVEVTELSELLQVSQVTVRKDLDKLEARGLIRREHGFALVASADNLASHLAYHYDVKRRIARAAAKRVQNGEIVMIESGSCCALLAEEIARTKRGATVITNSAFIADFVRQAPFARVVLLGGDYQNESQVMVGPITRACAANFFVDKLFIGTDGFNETSGFAARDYMRAETVRDLACRAKQVIVLTESSKFSRHGVVPLLGVDAVSAVHTDESIPAGTERYLTERGITVHKVAAS